MKNIDDSAITRDGKSLIVAHDHGLEHGPEDFEPNPESADPEHVFEVAQHEAVTALALQKGLAEHYREFGGDTPLLVKLNGNSNLWSPEDHMSYLNCSVKYAVEELNADAVGFTFYAGSDNEERMAQDFRRIQEEARKYDVSVVMWAYPRGHGIESSEKYEGDTDPEVIAYAARLGLEMGADMVKCKYPGLEGWKDVEEVTSRMKTVMSGGSKASDEKFLSDVAGMIEAGGNGLAVGRNVFQREDPESILDSLEKVIYEEKTVEESL
ncbi:class I fructose-bisphosphate aldolase [Candidatus Nanohalococcus occultus]|uniref:Fructose-bisphosphate aldolase, class I n=1 Tax=Candidatus Nanohalococcus occultus TaxID=2978047 RepID=A0ABY8CHK8_9ARCH|nr:Fructose-bisphosphate aldolase, class I [Candidatus Nanohaloarchaeota archaeon SVXNc]